MSLLRRLLARLRRGDPPQDTLQVGEDVALAHAVDEYFAARRSEYRFVRKARLHVVRRGAEAQRRVR
jgi:hypothetical protein